MVVVPDGDVEEEVVALGEASTAARRPRPWWPSSTQPSPRGEMPSATCQVIAGRIRLVDDLVQMLGA